MIIIRKHDKRDAPGMTPSKETIDIKCMSVLQSFTFKQSLCKITFSRSEFAKLTIYKRCHLQVGHILIRLETDDDQHLRNDNFLS